MKALTLQLRPGKFGPQRVLVVEVLTIFKGLDLELALDRQALVGVGHHLLPLRVELPLHL